MSIWQTKNWQELLLTSGQVEKYFVVDDLYIEKRKVSFGEYGLFITGVSEGVWAKSIDALTTLCRDENCLFLQVETLRYPPFTTEEVPEGTEVIEDDFPELSEKLKQLGVVVGEYYKKFIPPYSAVIDLSNTLETLQAQMKPKGRYNIKLAAEKGVTCSRMEKTDDHIESFHKLLEITTKRDGFTGNTFEYYKKLLLQIPESELFLCMYQDRIIAGGIFIFTKESALYYYGASSNEDRNVMAPYLLQWTAIQEAKKRGCELYDFLGVADPGEKNSPLSGVSEFKTKFTSFTPQVSTSCLYISKKKKYFFMMMCKWLMSRVKN